MSKKLDHLTILGKVEVIHNYINLKLDQDKISEDIAGDIKYLLNEIVTQSRELEDKAYLSKFISKAQFTFFTRQLGRTLFNALNDATPTIVYLFREDTGQFIEGIKKPEGIHGVWWAEKAIQYANEISLQIAALNEYGYQLGIYESDEP